MKAATITTPVAAVTAAPAAAAAATTATSKHKHLFTSSVLLLLLLPLLLRRHRRFCLVLPFQRRRPHPWKRVTTCPDAEQGGGLLRIQRTSPVGAQDEPQASNHRYIPIMGGFAVATHPANICCNSPLLYFDAFVHGGPQRLQTIRILRRLLPAFVVSACCCIWIHFTDGECISEAANDGTPAPAIFFSLHHSVFGYVFWPISGEDGV